VAFLTSRSLLLLQVGGEEKALALRESTDGSGVSVSGPKQNCSSARAPGVFLCGLLAGRGARGCVRTLECVPMLLPCSPYHPLSVAVPTAAVVARRTFSRLCAALCLSVRDEGLVRGPALLTSHPLLVLQIPGGKQEVVEQLALKHGFSMRGRQDCRKRKP